MTASTNSVSSPDKINTAVFQEQAPMTPTDQKTNEAWQGCTRAEEIPPTSPQVVFNLDERLKALEKGMEGMESAILKTEKALEKGMEGMESAILKLEKGMEGMESAILKTEKGIEEIKKMLENAPSNPYQIVSKDEKTMEGMESAILKTEKALEKGIEGMESAILKTEKGIEKALEKGVEKGIEEIKKMLENAPSNPYQIVSKDEKTIEEAIKLLEEASVITGINKDKKIIEVKKDEAIGFFQNFGKLALEGVKFTRDLSIIAAIGGTLLILFFPPAREKFCVVVGKILLKIVVPAIEKLESSVKTQFPGLTDAIQRGVERGSPSCAIV